MDYENYGRQFIDHSDIIGYICDTQTYELLYMTTAAMQTYGMADPKEYQGQMCYKVLHGLDAPCPFCSNDKLTSEHEYRWNHYNEKLGRWFGSTDRLVMLDDRRCRLQISKDITTRKEKDIPNATGDITMEDVIYHCMNIMAEDSDIEVSMTRILNTVGAYYQADRACLLEIDVERKIIKQSFEWCQEGISSGLDLRMDFNTLSDWLPVLGKGENIFISSIQDELDHNSEVYHILEKQGVHSLTLAPVHRKGRLVGFFSVDNPHIRVYNTELLQAVSNFILKELQRRWLSEQLDFANTQTDIQQLLDYIRENLDVDVAYVLEALTTGRGFLFTNMSVSDAKYNLVGVEQKLSEEDFRRSTSIYDKEGLCDYNLDSVDEQFDTSVLHYGVFQGRECNGSIGIIDYKHPGRKWTTSERAMIRRAGQAISSAIISSRLEKVNTELAQTQKQLKETAAALRQERQMYRDALLHDCDYAYLINVSKNKIEDVYKGGFLEKYGFSVNRPYDEAMSLVVETMKPVILNGMTEFHLTSHYIAAFEHDRRMVEVEYFVPDTGAYKRKSLFLSKDEYGTMYVFVVTHDITTRRREELETEKSLTQLAEVAKEVGKGNLDVQIELGAPGLVGVLADVLNQTILHLKWSIDKLNRQATQDPMTGVKNKRAWQDAEKRLDEEIKVGAADFAVVVCDVNNLKQLNDTIGHEAGDSLIIRASRHICQIFKHSPVYRIGGDEFTVILEGTDLTNYESLLTEFYAGMAAQPQGSTAEPPVSIALGISHYTQGDTSFSDVFHRADEAMYQKKAAMKTNQ